MDRLTKELVQGAGQRKWSTELAASTSRTAHAEKVPLRAHRPQDGTASRAREHRCGRARFRVRTHEHKGASTKARAQEIELEDKCNGAREREHQRLSQNARVYARAHEFARVLGGVDSLGSGDSL